MKQHLLKLIQTFQGTMLGIGLEDAAYLQAIENNPYIHECDLLESISLEEKEPHKRYFLPKLKKRYYKKKVDVVLVNADVFKKSSRKLLSFTATSTQHRIYLYHVQDETYLKKYRRYTKQITDLGHSIYEINMENVKIHRIKELGFYLIDTLEYIVDIIGEILVS